jgi:hypothetical protein
LFLRKRPIFSPKIVIVGNVDPRFTSSDKVVQNPFDLLHMYVHIVESFSISCTYYVCVHKKLENVKKNSNGRSGLA